MDKLRARPSEAENAVAGLTGQDRTLLTLLGEGLTNRQIGERMFLAEKTVKNHVPRLLHKLGVERRTQAAILAAEPPANVPHDNRRRSRRRRSAIRSTIG